MWYMFSYIFWFTRNYVGQIYEILSFFQLSKITPRFIISQHGQMLSLILSQKTKKKARSTIKNLCITIDKHVRCPSMFCSQTRTLSVHPTTTLTSQQLTQSLLRLTYWQQNIARARIDKTNAAGLWVVRCIASLCSHIWCVCILLA